MNEILLVSFWILFELNTYRFMAKFLNFLLQYFPVSSFFRWVIDENVRHSRVKFRRRRFCFLLFENILQKNVKFLMYNWSLIYVKFRHHFHKCTNKSKNMEKRLFCDNMTEKRRQNQEGSVRAGRFRYGYAPCTTTYPFTRVIFMIITFAQIPYFSYVLIRRI